MLILEDIGIFIGVCVVMGFALIAIIGGLFS